MPLSSRIEGVQNALNGVAGVGVLWPAPPPANAASSTTAPSETRGASHAASTLDTATAGVATFPNKHHSPLLAPPPSTSPPPPAVPGSPPLAPPPKLHAPYAPVRVMRVPPSAGAAAGIADTANGSSAYSISTPAIEPARYRSPRHRMSTNSRDEFPECVSMTWRAIGRSRHIAWVQCPYRVVGKASALRAGK